MSAWAPEWVPRTEARWARAMAPVTGSRSVLGMAALRARGSEYSTAPVTVDSSARAMEAHSATAKVAPLARATALEMEHSLATGWAPALGLTMGPGSAAVSGPVSAPHSASTLRVRRSLEQMVALALDGAGAEAVSAGRGGLGRVGGVRGGVR